MTDDKQALARQYLELIQPSIKQPMREALGKTGPIVDMIDWDRIFEPLLEPLTAGLTADDLRHAISWWESPTCQLMVKMQSQIAGLVKASVALEIERLSASTVALEELARRMAGSTR
jgi:hypothetical protein